MIQYNKEAHAKNISNLAYAFVAVKAAHFLLISMSPAQFDVSTSILLKAHQAEKSILCEFDTPSFHLNWILKHTLKVFLDKFLDRLVTWDAVYFADLFVNGVQYEHQFVFCPLWWRLIHIMPVSFRTPFYSRLMWATAISNACHFLSAVVLYFYTLSVFEKARIFSPLRMANAASMLYICSPAAAFLTAPYSESPAAFCSFLCLYAREVGVGQEYSKPRVNLQPAGMSGKIQQGGKATGENVSKSAASGTSETQAKPFPNIIASQFPASTVMYLVSGVFAALAFGFRANCLFLGLIYAYDLVGKKCKSRLLPLIAGSILGAAFFVTQVHSYAMVCDSKRGEWCESRVPLLFSYAQSHYWNNGLLKYWTLNNVPNFVFAAPMAGLSVYGMKYFAQIYPVERILPVLAVNAVFLVSVLLFWHVQIITRVHTFLPIVYWLVAGLLTQQSVVGRKWADFCVAYFLVWNVLQVSLFAAFLPPA